MAFQQLRTLICTFSVIFCLSSSFATHGKPSPYIFRNLGVGALVGGANFTMLQLTTKNREKNPMIHPLRNHVTSVYSGTGVFSLLSGVPPVQVMGLGFLGLSAWGHYLAYKNPKINPSPKAPH